MEPTKAQARIVSRVTSMRTKVRCPTKPCLGPEADNVKLVGWSTAIDHLSASQLNKKARSAVSLAERQRQDRLDLQFSH